MIGRAVLLLSILSHLLDLDITTKEVVLLQLGFNNPTSHSYSFPHHGRTASRLLP